MLKTYGKAATAFLGTLLGAVGTAMADGAITTPEVVTAVGAALVVGGATVYAPYRPAE